MEEVIGSLTDQGVNPLSATHDRTPRGSLQHLSNPSASGQRTGSFKLTPEEQRIRFLTTLGAFRGIAQSLGGRPGRKTVVWLSSGLSLKPLLEDNMPFWRTTMDQLNANDIAIYGVDAMGLRLLSGFNASIGARNSPTRGPVTLPLRPDVDFDILRLMAEETGGRVYANSNDIESALTDARLDAESAYELTFIPDRIDERPKKHQLQVNISRPHSNVRYRLTYWSMSANSGFASEKSQIVDDVLASPMEATAFSVAAKIDRESERNGEFNILVLVEPRNVELSLQHGRWLGTMEFVAAQFDKQSRLLSVDREQIDLNLEGARYQQFQRDGFLHSLTVKKNQQAIDLRILVVDYSVVRAGSVTLPWK